MSDSPFHFIAVDIGNTSATFGQFKGDNCTASFHVDSTTIGISEARLLIQSWLPKTLSGAIIGSVVPELNPSVMNLLELCFGIKPLVVTPDVRLPLKNLYAAGKVGSDRLANAVAASARYGAPVIVVDVGTAATLDIVSPDGSFAGGAILPGPRLSIQSLASKTALLPSVPLKRPEVTIGRNTIQAIQSGVLTGLAGALNHLATESWQEMNASGKIIGTGGFIGLAAECGLRVDHIDPHLTLAGLKMIWEYNAL